MVITIGVLALQGDFAEHIKILESMKVNAIEVRNNSDLQKCSALIIPGGESTTIGKLLKISGLDREIKKRAKKAMPIYGTCAGAIVLAKKVLNEKEFFPLELIDVEIKRNAYGRQLDSFEAEVEIKGIGKLNGVFIRAPVISKIGKKIEVLAKFEGKPVLVKQGNILIGTFHPETEKNSELHNYFLGFL
ncbi:MAG: pyridoxal 5'-phosphate synthase glutaminase subunit PdxT [archaeon]|nr:pyridoxal 5'-phosphate synthase glutaminase subunit PdxT [archaeon]